ncbi:GIY-YIG nuclease family protein [Tenuifilum thalassicum]|uniref:GIY-YIG nuclease family protein n=1 Tax=Tenuifilum thalassicum TaxID=2590900 RepID=A0A7D4BJ20_9BACT|nr:GIY-YIG nuclease family protein [Tenuifilum thalassicum]QKG79179.1 GIY-YIG nuclease family protein [Tenuifilum thalassicum]
MYYVYAIYSERCDKIYIGYTSDLEARLAAHNHPKNKGWTRRYRPWELVYYEEYTSKRDALTRERELKGHKGRDFIRELIGRRG